MEELEFLIYHAIVQKWPDIKLLPNRFFNKADEEGREDIISYDPPWSVSLVVQDSDRIMVSLYHNGTEENLRLISRHGIKEGTVRLPYKSYWVKNIVNHHGRYLVEYQGSEGQGVTDYLSPSEFANKLYTTIESHDNNAGGMDSGG